MPHTTRPKGGRPKYTPEQRANALAVLERNGGNAKKTARDTNVERTTLREWANRKSDNVRAVLHKDAPVEDREEQAGRFRRFSGLAMDKAMAAVALLDPKKMTSRDIREIVVSAAVGTEKDLLLSGKSTSRVGFEPLAVFFSSALRTPEPQAAIEGSYHVEDQDKTPAVVEKRDKRT